MKSLWIGDRIAEAIAIVAMQAKPPVRKECILLPRESYTEIRRLLGASSDINECRHMLNREVVEPLRARHPSGRGAMVVDGLYKSSCFPYGVNPSGYLSADLAPFDFVHNRAFDLNVDLVVEQVTTLIVFACLLGVPFRMFNEKSFVIPVTNHSSVPRSRFGGQGINPLHKDGGFLVPRPSSNPICPSMGPGTELSLLMCINADREGGGVNWIVEDCAEQLLAGLSSREISLLSSQAFSYIPAYGLNDCKALSTFSVLYRDHFDRWRLRYSGKLGNHLSKNWDGPSSVDKQELLALLQKIDDFLMARKSNVLLRPGQILCMNQHSTLHGRSPSHDSNRILVQVFVRVPYTGGSALVSEYESMLF